MEKKPLIYESSIDVRFSDVDMYGHVSTKHYIDFITDSRWKFHMQKFGLGPESYAEKGFGFFTARMETFFKKAISAKQKTIFVKSFVEELDRAKVSVKFEIFSADKEVLHSYGEMDFYCVDLKSGKPQAVPEWIHPYFFET